MKLKKLEITGFKSFFDKSAIQFPAGISAVVGPNGCGKSNIVDALRWVMGEQSVKQLRGKAMEDVIFSGAAGKAALNMAEVSLTLVNDNGSAPEELRDFSEIMITRRQYRSGERQYFLNRQPCRLKDIHNIFWGSGMGARSYAVIQQGNIGAITDAGPEERRFFIEEAAGVTRYKNRKNEALRKVNATHQNLLRLNDIIAEINRQMNGLNRQAKKAERFKRFQAQLKALEITAAAYHYDDYARQIAETEDLLQELKDTDLEQTAKLTRLDAAVEQIKLERTEKSRELAAQKSVQFEAQRKTDKIESDLDHFKKDISALTEEILGLKAAQGGLEEKSRQIAGEVAQTEAEIDRLGADIDKEKDQLKAEEEKARSATEELARLNHALDAGKKRMMELVAEEAKYKNIHQNAFNNKESLKRRLRRIDEEEVLAERKVAELEQSETEAKAGLAQVREEVAAVTAEIERLEKDLKDKNAALSNQIRLVQSTEIERGKVKSRWATLVKMDENLEWYKDGVKAIMRRQGPAGSEDAGEPAAAANGVIGLMADVLEPEPGYETAVEAVLGEAMQYILVENQSSGAGAIGYLQTHNAGRSGFVPVSGVKKTRRHVEAIAEEAERLLDHVSVKNGYETVAATLMDDVLVADNLQQATAVWNRANGDGPYTVVTRQGDLVSAQGVMIGGSKDKLSGILLKKKEIKNLKKQHDQLEKTLEEARRQQEALEQGARQLETDLQQTIARKSQAQRKEHEVEKDLYRLAEALKHARRHLEVVQLEQEQLLGEESDIDDEIARYNDVLLRVARDVEAAQALVSETTGKIEEVAATVAAFNQSVVDVKLRMTALTARYDNSRQTLRRMKDFQSDGIQRLAQLKEEIEQKTRRKQLAEEKAAEYDRQLPAMYAEVQRLEKALESGEADFQAIDHRLQENDEVILKIKGEREKTLEKIRYIELDQSQRRMKQENVSRRIEEKYHGRLEVLRRQMTGPETDEPADIQAVERDITDLREKIANVGDVNLGAINEYNELKTRYEFLISQKEDLLKALDDLQRVIRKINRITQDRFMKTFHQVNEKLTEVFPRLFQGGTAKLVLTDPDDPLETGVELMIHPPGKKLTLLSLLSGGEKALSAIAFIFAIFLIKPASFCLMDEIDAPLDEANVYRFNELLKIIGEQSQIVMITHNKKTMEFADVLFGVTMEKKGISKIVSVDFERAA